MNTLRRFGVSLITATWAAAVLASSLSGCGGRSLGSLLPEGCVYPEIAPEETSTVGIPSAYSFTFEGTQQSVSAIVDAGVYAGADHADKRVIRFGGSEETDWVCEYYPAFIDEPHQDAFYDALLAQLRGIRDAEGLDADRYAELMCVFVQSIPYQTDPVDLQPKFPIETFVEGSGDCDDKTLLLAGLLAREGYDTVVLLFEAEQHVALGLRSNDLEYRDTGYAYVETTAYAFIGQVPPDLAGGITLTSSPRVIEVDGGTQRYGAADEVAAILRSLAEADAHAVELAGQVRTLDQELVLKRAEVEASAAELERLQDSGRVAEYNARVPEHNALAEEYNALVEQRNAVADEHNDAAALVTYVYGHLDDRRGTYQWVTSHPIR